MQITGTSKMQMTYYFKTGEFESFEFTNKLYEALKEIFKCFPQALPVPMDAPADLPRCIWDSPNVTLMYSLLKLDIMINIPTEFKWKQIVEEFSQKINTVIQETAIQIDRIGIITENLLEEETHNELNKKVSIVQFQDAKELNIAWRENCKEESSLFNVWTNIFINDEVHNNKVVFDINSVKENSSIDIVSTLEHAVILMERKMQNVF